MREYVWLDLFIIFLSLSSLFFTWKYIYEIAVQYNQLRLKYAKHSYSQAYKS